MVVSHGVSSLSQSVVGSHKTKLDWPSIDDGLKVKLSPIQCSLNVDEMDTSETSKAFAGTLHFHLDEQCVLGHPCSSKEPHKNQSIVKLTHRLACEKNQAGRSFKTHPSLFLSGVRAHNKYVKAAKRSTMLRSVRSQEKAFKLNHLAFLKKAEIWHAVSKKTGECYYLHVGGVINVGFFSEPHPLGGYFGC